MRDAIARRSMFNVVHLESVVKVDFIVRKDDEYRHEEFARRRQTILRDSSIWVVSREDLILSKLFWARRGRISQTQLADIRNLLAADYDSAYLNAWALKLGLNDLLKENSNE